MHRAFDFHLQLPTDSHTLSVGDAVPDERAGRVPVESFCVSYAGFNRSRNRAMSGNPRVIEVIE